MPPKDSLKNLIHHLKSVAIIYRNKKIRFFNPQITEEILDDLVIFEHSKKDEIKKGETKPAIKNRGKFG
jgi:hypothetical protein